MHTQQNDQINSNRQLITTLQLILIYIIIIPMSLETKYQQIYEEMQLIQKLSEYSVYLVRNNADKQYYIAKKILIFELDDKAQDQIFKQCKVLKSLNHPHIIKYKDIFLEEDEIIIILEYCQQGDLSFYLKKKIQRKQWLSQKLILSWILQLLMALQYIHQNKVIHREIILPNIYLNSKGNLKLGSFVHSKILENTMCKAKTKIGSLNYMSPQMIDDKPYNSKCDMWAFGCIIYELCTFKVLFDSHSMAQIYQKIKNHVIPDLPSQYMKNIYPIYKKLLKKNPNSRASASELLKLPVFIRVIEDYIKKKKIDAIEIRQIPVKKLATHEKFITTQKKRLLLPPLKKSNNTPLIKQKQVANKNSNKTFEMMIQTPPRKFMKSEVLQKSNSKNKLQKQNRNDSVSKKQRSNESYEISPESQKQFRLTKKQNAEQEKSIEQLYKLQILLICKELELKYGPKQGPIYERTMQYESQQI